MKKVYIGSFIIIILLISSKNILAQQNIVPNPGFETISDIQHVCSQTALHGAFNYNKNKEYWSKVAHWDTPDRSEIRCGVASPDVSCVIQLDHHVRNGSFAARGGECEYLTVNLLKNMEVGQWYYVEYYILNSSPDPVNLNSYGIHFSEDKPKQCMAGDCRINESPHVAVPPNLTLQPNQWYRVSKYFQPNEEYEWLLIGNYGSSPMIHWDDFVIYPLGPTVCPPNRLVENTAYTASDFTLQAAHEIRAGRDVGSPIPNGMVRVMPGADITYKAEDCISLEDGFEVLLGGEFEAFNAPCNLDCPADNFSFNLSTGVTGETPDAFGTVDNQWKYVLDETGSTPASDIMTSTLTSSSWGASSTQANWINPDGNSNVYPIGTYTFEVSFNIDFNEVWDPKVLINEIAVDNSARIYLNNLPVVPLGHQIVSGNIEPAPWPGSDYNSTDNMDQLHGPYVISHPIYFNNGINRLRIEVYNDFFLMAVLMNVRFHYMECTAGTGRYGDSGGDRDTSLSDAEIAAIYQYREELEKQPNHRLMEADHLAEIQRADTVSYNKMENNQTITVEQLEIKSLKISPNPNNGHFTITLPDEYVENISITDMLGKTVFTTSTPRSALDIDLSSYGKGMYFVKVQVGKAILVEKVVLQ